MYCIVSYYNITKFILGAFLSFFVKHDDFQIMVLQVTCESSRGCYSVRNNSKTVDFRKFPRNCLDVGSKAQAISRARLLECLKSLFWYLQVLFWGSSLTYASFSEEPQQKSKNWFQKIHLGHAVIYKLADWSEKVNPTQEFSRTVRLPEALNSGSWNQLLLSSPKKNTHKDCCPDF